MRIDIPLTRFPRKLRFVKTVDIVIVIASLQVTFRRLVYLSAKILKIRKNWPPRKRAVVVNNSINNSYIFRGRASLQIERCSNRFVPSINIVKTIDNSLRAWAKFTRGDGIFETRNRLHDFKNFIRNLDRFSRRRREENFEKRYFSTLDIFTIANAHKSRISFRKIYANNGGNKLSSIEY